MTIDNEDVEITLSAGDLRVKVSPCGAALRGLWREASDGTRQEIVTAYTGAKGKVGGQGDVLIPFPGRVKDGRYTFAGQNYQMPANDKDGPNAIHGFLRLVPWEIEAQSERSITFTVALNAADHPGYPFSLQAAITYTLEEDGMTCGFKIANTGAHAAPVAVGYHPYFTVGSEFVDFDTLQLPATGILEFKNLLPTGRVIPVEGTPYDFRQPRSIGDLHIDNCFVNPVRDPDGVLRVRLAASQGDRAVTVWMDETFDYVVVFTGDTLPADHRRRAIAVEPMTCGSDAFNHPEWGLIALAPGQHATGTWGVTPS